jgi:hypothetical protein
MTFLAASLSSRSFFAMVITSRPTLTYNQLRVLQHVEERAMPLGSQKAQSELNILADLITSRYAVRWGNPVLRDEQLDQIQNDFAAGKSDAEIARKLGTTASAVQYRRLQMGVARPPKERIWLRPG